MCRSKADGGRRCSGHGPVQAEPSSGQEVTQHVWGDADGKYHAEDAPQIPDGAKLGLQNWENRDGFRVNVTRYEHKGVKHEILHRYGPADPTKEALDKSSVEGMAHWASDYDRPAMPLTDKFLEDNADKGPWPEYHGKGAPRTHGTDGDMGTRENPWPNAPWDMSPGQKADHDYEQPVGVGVRDTEQAVKGWLKGKLAGRT